VVTAAHPQPLAAVLAEVVGTFMLTFSGTATVLATHKLHPQAGMNEVAISLAFALGILAAIYVFATVSGAHINPAVTTALAAVGEFPWRVVPAYIAAQFTGGILAGLMNWFMFGGQLRAALLLGTTKPGPGVGWGPALFTEFVITAVLMIVIMATAVYQRSPGGAVPSGLAIAFWIGAAIFLALPVSGGSMNPARTLGPDIAAAAFPCWWIYVVGPVLGAGAGACLWKFILSKGRLEEITGSKSGPATERPLGHRTGPGSGQ
jgi:MIP family channel proteins